MPYTQNGWLHLHSAALEAKYLTTISIPGTNPIRRFRVRKGNVAKCFAWLGKQFHERVESLNEGHPNDDWSFADRPIRGSGSTSNHASGTAVDYNATQHYLGANNTFKASQERKIHEILDEADGVFRWGGDYSGRKDEMHFEINKGADAVAALAKKIGDIRPEPVEDIMDKYYANIQNELIKPYGTYDEPQFLHFRRNNKWYKGVVNSGKAGTLWVATIQMYFNNEDLVLGETVSGRLIFSVRDDEGKEHADYGSVPFWVSKWDNDDPAALPGRGTVVMNAGEAYGPDRYLWVGIEASKQLQLVAPSQARILFSGA